jgi:hypothetical protein
VARINHGVYPKPHVVNKDVDRRLTPVVHKALRKKPGDRYETADEMHAAIADFLHDARLRPNAAQLAGLVTERITEDRLAEIVSRRAP